MGMQPIREEDATGETRMIYDRLRLALGSAHVPIFFTYIAPFHDYFAYLANQLIDILKDEKFLELMSQMKRDIVPLVVEKLEKSEETESWINRYRFSPSFYNFQQSIDSICTINLKLALVFIALREAVKGWAVSAHKLPSSASVRNQETEGLHEDRFVYDVSDVADYQPDNNTTYGITHIRSDTRPSSLAKSQHSPLEKDLIHEYLAVCRADFSAHMKKDYFWILRIGLEQIILTTLPVLPKRISSPINTVWHLTKKYDSQDLICYLAEHFPTFSMHRMMFSAYMAVKKN